MSYKENKQILNHSLGAFAGLLLGDSIGSYLEFCTDDIKPEMVQKALEMPGGGCWKVGSGQITDDGELALSLAYALMNKDPKDGFPREEVFKSYHAWFNSHPFDIGSTCRYAFASPEIDEKLEVSQRSQSNGGLMRILPLAIWGRDLSSEILGEYAKIDARLSHPNKVCQEVNAIYTLAVAHLLKNQGDNEGCIRFLKEYISEAISQKDVKEWFEGALKDNILDAGRNMGYIKYAFWMSIYHLNKGSTFIEAITQTLQAGGDTDTNCAIVGGIIGTLNGYTSLPSEMMKKLLSFDPTTSGVRRPHRFKPSNFVDLVRGMFKEE